MHVHVQSAHVHSTPPSSLHVRRALGGRARVRTGCVLLRSALGGGGGANCTCGHPTQTPCCARKRRFSIGSVVSKLGRYSSDHLRDEVKPALATAEFPVNLMNLHLAINCKHACAARSRSAGSAEGVSGTRSRASSGTLASPCPPTPHAAPSAHLPRANFYTPRGSRRAFSRPPSAACRPRDPSCGPTVACRWVRKWGLFPLPPPHAEHALMLPQ